jgi:hypothetical protein
LKERQQNIRIPQEIDTFLAPQTIILQTKTVAKMRKQCSKIYEGKIKDVE